MSQLAKETERISAKEFMRRTQEDPSWAKNLSHPVIVYEYVDMSNSNIRYLSRWLRFSGKNMMGESANFSGTKELENGEGTYDGSVDFSKSGIKTIGRLKVLGRYLFMTQSAQKESFSAYFYQCFNLKKLSGEFAYAVAAAESNISVIENFKVRNSDSEYKVDLSCNPTKKIGKGVELLPNDILWDEHTDDEARSTVEKELNKRLKIDQGNQGPESTQDTQIPRPKIRYVLVRKGASTTNTDSPTSPNPQSEESGKNTNFLEESKRIVVRTLAEAIGADDILSKNNVPLTSPKRRGLFRISTIILACVGLFIYKTSDEIIKQTLVDPVVRAVTGNKPAITQYDPHPHYRHYSNDPTPSLLSEETKIKTSQGIWTNELTQDLDRYAKSSMSYDDKIALARATLIALDLDPNILSIDTEPFEKEALKLRQAAAASVLANGLANGLRIPLHTMSDLKSKTKDETKTYGSDITNQQVLLAAQKTIEELEELKEIEKIKQLPITNGLSTQTTIINNGQNITLPVIPMSTDPKDQTPKGSKKFKKEESIEIQ